MDRLFRKRTHIIDRLLSSYLDGRVTARERELVEAHLPSCVQCRTRLEGMRHTVAFLKRMPQAEVPRSFVFGRPPVAETIRSPWRKLAPVWTSGLAAAVVAVLFVVVLVADLSGRLAGESAVSPGPASQQAPQARSADTEKGVAALPATSQPEAVPAPAAAQPDATKAAQEQPQQVQEQQPSLAPRTSVWWRVLEAMAATTALVLTVFAILRLARTRKA